MGSEDQTTSGDFTLPYEWGELVEKIQQGDCVLFLGADTPYGFDRKVSPPSSLELAGVIAQRCGYEKSDLKLPEASQFYETRFKRHSLVELVRNQVVGQPVYKPSKLHKIISEIPFSAIITTRLDTLLEATLDRAGRPYQVVTSNTEVPYIDASKLLILKLHGSITQPDSLVLTKRDSFALHRRLETVLNFVRYLFVTKHLLFLDYNLDDFEFQVLFDEVIHTVGIHHRRAYAVYPDFSSDIVTLWPDVSLATITNNSTEFLEKLKKDFKAKIPVSLSIHHSTDPIDKPPYKFLDYFLRSDSDIFYGRDLEILYCWRRILSYSLVTIFGQSGAGKTSLFLAGISPLLEQEGYRIVIVRPLNDPLEALKHAMFQQLNLEIDLKQSLVEIFSSLGSDTKIVVALDQFEEIFISAGENSRSEFYKELSEVVVSTTLDIRFVILLREDYLALLDEARNRLPQVFINSYRLMNLTRDQARLAISEPAIRAGLAIETTLLDKLLDDLDEGGIAPPQLQIICHELYKDCLSISNRDIEQNLKGAALTLERYQFMGGAEKILGDYLDSSINEIEAASGPTEKAAVVEVLKIMVSSQQTKLAMMLDEIVELGKDRHIPLNVVSEAVATLVDKRLVRRFERSGAPFFELAHDYISHHVAEWISEEEWAFKRVREMLIRELGNWQVVKTLIPEERFKLINSLREDLHHITLEEADLLVRCSFEYGIDYGYWLERSVANGADVWNLIDTVLEHPNPFVRARVAECVGKQERHQATRYLRKLLHDEGVKVREIAIEQVEEMRCQEVIGNLIQLLNDEYLSVCWRSAKALFTIGTYEAIKALEDYWPQDMVFVEEGECLIGNTESEVKKHVDATGNDVFYNELPQHKVFVGSFLMDRYLVTNADFMKFVIATGHHPPGDWINGEIPEGTENQPVSHVSLSDSRAYAIWAGKRLPTEYEWEKAVSWNPEKAEKYQYPWGNNFDKSLCRVEIHVGNEPYTDVGKYSPQGDSYYGVTDAIGNGWVWVDGIFGPYPGAKYNHPTYSQNLYVQRSCGGWENEASHAYHITHRVGMADVMNAEVTFRCVMSMPDYLLPAINKRHRGNLK